MLISQRGIARNENRLKTIRDYKIGALHQPELGEASGVPRPPLLGIRPKARKRRAQLAIDDHTNGLNSV